jgi:hypothetical protein
VVVWVKLAWKFRDVSSNLRLVSCLLTFVGDEKVGCLGTVVV